MTTAFTAESPAGALTLPDAMRARFDREVAKYPPDQAQSAVMACLAIVQQEHGHVTPAAEAMVAAFLGMPAIAVREVVTFYNMYNTSRLGTYKINVCTNLPCQLRDGEKALAHLCTKLGVDEGGTTEDGLFTIQKAECLGACADSPVMLVNDRQMVSFMSNERIDALLDTLTEHAKSQAGSPAPLKA